MAALLFLFFGSAAVSYFFFFEATPFINTAVIIKKYIVSMSKKYSYIPTFHMTK